MATPRANFIGWAFIFHDKFNESALELLEIAKKSVVSDLLPQEPPEPLHGV